MSEVNLTRAILFATKLQGAELGGIRLSYSQVSYCDLSGKNLSGVYWKHANFADVRLGGTDLGGARLLGVTNQTVARFHAFNAEETLRLIRRKSSLLITCGLLATMLCIPWLILWRQYRFDHDLIEAVRRNDTQAAITLLNRGADANARFDPHSATSAWHMLLNRLRGKPAAVANASSPLLILLDRSGKADANSHFERDSFAGERRSACTACPLSIRQVR